MSPSLPYPSPCSPAAPHAPSPAHARDCSQLPRAASARPPASFPHPGQKKKFFFFLSSSSLSARPGEALGWRAGEEGRVKGARGHGGGHAPQSPPPASPPARSPRLRNPAGTRTQRSRRQPGSVAAAPPPGTRSGFPLLPPSNLPTRSPPVRLGEQPERSGLACPPPPSHPPGPATPPPPSCPDAHGRCPAQRRDRGGNCRLLPEPAAQPCRRPRPGLRGAEPSRGREDGGREAGALRSPAPPPPPAAGENCACLPAGRPAGEARAPPPGASLPALPTPGSRRPSPCPGQLVSSRPR